MVSIQSKACTATYASTKCGAKESGGTYEAGLLDLMEHGGHGRLIVYDPMTRVTKTLLDGLNFAKVLQSAMIKAIYWSMKRGSTE